MLSRIWKNAVEQCWVTGITYFVVSLMTNDTDESYVVKFRWLFRVQWYCHDDGSWNLEPEELLIVVVIKLLYIFHKY